MNDLPAHRRTPDALHDRAADLRRRARHGRARRRRARRLDRRTRRVAGLARAIDLGAGRRAAHRFDALLCRDAAAERRARTDPVADAGAGRGRRGAGRRIGRGWALDLARPGHARPLDADRLDASFVLGRREGKAGRRHHRSERGRRSGRRRRQARHRFRHGNAGDQEQQRDLGVSVRRAGRIRHVAVRRRKPSKASSAPAAAASNRA